jgi:hypothetical protein
MRAVRFAKLFNLWSLRVAGYLNDHPRPLSVAAPHAAREVYEQFLGAARELLGGEPSSEELHQSATLIYESLASLELDDRGQFSRTELAGKR